MFCFLFLDFVRFAIRGSRELRENRMPGLTCETNDFCFPAGFHVGTTYDACHTALPLTS